MEFVREDLKLNNVALAHTENISDSNEVGGSTTVGEGDGCGVRDLEYELFPIARRVLKRYQDSQARGLAKRPSGIEYIIVGSGNQQRG